MGRSDATGAIAENVGILYVILQEIWPNETGTPLQQRRHVSRLWLRSEAASRTNKIL